MAEAKLRVSFAGGLVTFQDAGRFGQLRYGVPASGPMDRVAFCAANVAVGNSPEQTAIEISLGGLVLNCIDGPVQVAVTGGGFSVDHNGIKKSSWTVLTLKAGDTLSVRPEKWGSWAYLAVGGDLETPLWLNHSATHSMSGFGGGALTKGQDIAISNVTGGSNNEGDLPFPEFYSPNAPIRVVMGPQDHRFPPDTLRIFEGSEYVLSNAYDRMGVRLTGPELLLNDVLSIPSEPIVRGSIQVSGDGVPTVLLADHQITGGYPKIATVISPDINRFVQLRPNDKVWFKSIKPNTAVQIARTYANLLRDYLQTLAKRSTK